MAVAINQSTYLQLHFCYVLKYSVTLQHITKLEMYQCFFIPHSGRLVGHVLIALHASTAFTSPILLTSNEHSLDQERIDHPLLPRFILFTVEDLRYFYPIIAYYSIIYKADETQDS